MKPDTLKDELSEEVALKLAIGYRKLIKISSSDDTEELTALLQSFEARLVAGPSFVVAKFTIPNVLDSIMCGNKGCVGVSESTCVRRNTSII